MSQFNRYGIPSDSSFRHVRPVWLIQKLSNMITTMIAVNHDQTSQECWFANLELTRRADSFCVLLCMTAPFRQSMHYIGPRSYLQRCPKFDENCTVRSAASILHQIPSILGQP